MWDTNRENVVLIATLSLVLAIGSFILWGPTTRSNRKGHIVGLVNLGYSCFLNALLQALASCPVVMDWLSKQHHKKKTLASSLQRILLVLNGEEYGGNPATPSALIQSLVNQGWVISPGEQDAHELFHVIVTSLEEETQKPLKKVCSLLDVGLVGNNEPRKFHSVTGLQECHSLQLRPTVSCIETRNHQSEYKLRTPLPFHGLFTSKLQCMTCQHKSVVNYTTFYSLSLHLPPRKLMLNPIESFCTLQDLIGNYVANKVVNNVSCDGCGSPNTDQVKTLNFGKLPPCLCIHIARTTWEGEPMKRDDYIDFPEILIMDPYTYNTVQVKQDADKKLAKGDENVANGSVSLSPKTKKYKHMYQLVAVVVHKGSLLSGHFITYRRGIGKSYDSWYYTSDTEVKEATIYEVMKASAYMLFYTKLAVV